MDVVRAHQESMSDDRRFQLLDNAIYGLDVQGYVTSWNSGEKRFTGDTSRDVGRHFSTFYSPEDRAAGNPPWLWNPVPTRADSKQRAGAVAQAYRACVA